VAFLFFYYRSMKERIGGSGRLARLVHCLGGKVIDSPIANEYITGNIAFYILQNIILFLKSIKYVKLISTCNIVIFQPYSLPGSIIPLFIKFLQRGIVIVDDVNFHSLIEPLLIRLFSKFIHVIWTSSIYTLSQFKYYLGNKFFIHYVFTPLLSKHNTYSMSNKANLILFVGSRSFERYPKIAWEICHIAKELPNFKFVLVGTASEALIGKCSYQNVIVLGRVPDQLYSNLLKLARYILVFDTADYIYPGGMLIKIVDALEYGAYPIISWQFKYSFPFLKTVNVISDIYKLIRSNQAFQEIEYFIKVYSCRNLLKFLKFSKM